MKKTILTALLAMATSAAMANPEHNAPEGYIHFIDTESGEYIYIHLDSVKPQRFTHSTNPARLAIGSFWQWPQRNFHRVAANCDSHTYSFVKAGSQGREMAGEWRVANAGTIAANMVKIMCAVSYPTQSPKGAI